MKATRRIFSAVFALIFLYTSALGEAAIPAETLLPEEEMTAFEAEIEPAPEVDKPAGEAPEVERVEPEVDGESPEIIVEIPAEEAPAGDASIDDAPVEDVPEELPPVEVEEVLEETPAAEPTAEAPALFAESEELLPLNATQDGFVIEDGVLTDYTGSEPDITIPEGVTTIGSSALERCASLRSVTIPANVTRIGSSAFKDCTHLETVTMTDSISGYDLGSSAFQGCTSLQNVTLSNNITWMNCAFIGCTSLEHIDLPANLISIDNSCFSGCSSLQDIVIPSGVTEIGSNTFSGCTNLNSVTFQGEITSIESSAFKNCSNLAAIDIQDSVTTIQSSAFAGCSSLQSIQLPDGLTELGNSCLEGCSCLTTVSIPSKIIAINSGVFQNCTHLQTVELPANLESIGSSAFSGCDSLTSIDFIDGATSIGNNAFAYCDGLRDVHIPGSVTNIGSSNGSGSFIFSSCKNLRSLTIESGKGELHVNGTICSDSPLETLVIQRDVVNDGFQFEDPNSFYENEILFYGLKNLADVTISEAVTSLPQACFCNCGFTDIQLPSGLTEIPKKAFYDCDNLELIDIPSRVTRIGTGAFYDCDMLWRVNLPDGLTEIGDSAFFNCAKLDKINLPGGLASIGDSAFEYCDTLKSLNLPASLTHIGKNAFYGCGVASFDVPAGITEIPEGAFSSSYLTTIHLPATLTSIGTKAFQNSGLRSIEIPGSVSSIGSQAFANSRLDSIEIPEGVSSIGSRAFAESDLRSISFSRSLSAIETYLFAGCYNLTSITVPGYITTVKNYAFQGCENLTDVVLEKGVTKLGDGAFMDCGKLRMVKLPESLTSFGRYPFENCGNLTAFVTAGSEAETYCKQNNIPYSTGNVGAIEFTGVKDGDAIPAGFDYTLNWKAVSGANAYRVEWRVGNKHEDEDGIYWYWEGPEPETVTSPSITFTDRYGGGWVYLISVAAYRQSDSGGVLLADGSITLRPDFNVSFITFPATLRLGVGQSQTVAASSSRDSKFTYKSNNTNVATISAAGLVKALKAGTATLTAKGSSSGKSASCVLTVYPVPTKVSFSPSKLSIGVGQTSQLAAAVTPEGAEYELSYESSDEGIASVDDEGLVTGVDTGTATVTVKTGNGKSASCTVTVKPAPDSVRFEPAELTMTVGRGATLVPILDPANSAASFTYESDDNTVVIVDEHGNLEAVGVGNAIITATAQNKVQGIVTVHALAAPERIDDVPEGITLGVGESLTLAPSAGENRDIVYSFSSKSAGVASVSAAGKITARKAGETVVTVTADTGASANCNVTVLAAPSKFTLSASSATLGVGDELQLTATLPNNSASAISFSANDKGKYISVGADGKVTAVAPGAATVTAKTFNGKKASCKITVKEAPTSISLEPLTLSAGLSAALKLALVPAGAAASFAYESESPTIASVDADGIVTAIAPGDAQITVTAHNGTTGICQVHVMSAPDEVKLGAAEATLGKGESLTLHPAVANGSQTSFTFESSKSTVAAVDSKGKITAKKAGEAEITVRAHNGVEAICDITVVNAPSKLTLSASSATLGVDDELQLIATLPDGSASAISFSSSKEGVATVDAEGNIAAVAPGAAMITAKTFNGKKATCKVTVKEAPTSISLEPLTLSAGQSAALKPTLEPAGAAASFAYESNSDGIASVDEDGIITAIAQGDAEITVTAHNGTTGICQVHVMSAPDEVKLGAAEATLGKGESLTLHPAVANGSQTSFTYESSKPTVAAVDSKGRITAKKAGEAEITVRAHNGVEAICDITVVNAPSKLTLSATKATLGVSDKLQLIATLPDGSASAISFSSSKEGVATVDAEGNIAAVAPGTATITAKTFNGKKATCKVTVKGAPDSVSLGRDTLKLAEDQSFQLKPELSEGSAASFTYRSSASGIAAVDEDGLVTAVTPGSADITVTTYNGKSASCTVTVVSEPKRLSIDEITLGKGESLELKPSVDSGADSDVNPFSYSVKKATIAKLTTDGKRITGKAAGTTKLTVKTYNGLMADCEVTVTAAPASVSLSLKAATMSTGCKLRLDALLSGDTSSNLRYESDDVNVATVEEDGTVTAIAPGTAIITVQTYNGKKASFTLTVE